MTLITTGSNLVGIRDDGLSYVYPGLRPFREEEEHLFFGRERQVDAMVDRLAAGRFLAVVGTSGSGKSSLVNCGLRPALHRGLMASAGTSWLMAQFRPGGGPLKAMARALADGQLFGDMQSGMPLVEIVETTLRMSNLGLVDIYQQARRGRDVNLLVVVDQFEELFRYRRLGPESADAEREAMTEALAFVKLLLEARAHQECPIYVVLTMRSDFLGDCARFPGLPEAINAGLYLVPRLARSERRAAIGRPAGVANAEVSPVLLTRLVNDVGDDPDQLSIMQHALNRTWARWAERTGKEGPIELDDYRAIGTMASALDLHAEKAYAELDTERKRKICERIFKALTDRGTDARGIRRPMKMRTLCALAEASAVEITEVIDVFRATSRSFLMPPRDEVLEDDTVVDISHESLMRVWERLKGWTVEEAKSARMYRRVAETARLHVAGDASLWRDPDLQLALDWRDDEAPTAAWGDMYGGGFALAMAFLDDSEAQRTREVRDKEERAQRDLEQARDLAAARSRAAVWLRAGLVTALILATIATVTAVLARNAATEAGLARDNASFNLARLYEEKAETAYENQRFQEAWLYTLEALSQKTDTSRRLVNSFGRLLIPEIQPRVEWGDGILLEPDGETQYATTVAISPEGRFLVSGFSGGGVRLWDLNTNEDTVLPHPDAGVIGCTVFSPDGSTLATCASNGGPATGGAPVSASGTVRLWEWNTRRWAEKCGIPEGDLGDGPDALEGAAFSPDSRWLVTSSSNSVIRVWDTDTCSPSDSTQWSSNITGLAFDPVDSDQLVIAGESNRLDRWNRQTKEISSLLPGHADAAPALALSPDGTLLASGLASGSDQSICLRETASTEASPPDDDDPGSACPLELTARPLAVSFSPDGSILASSSTDNSVLLWRVSDETLLARLETVSAVNALAFDPTGRHLAFGLANGGVRLVNLTTPLFDDAGSGAEAWDLLGIVRDPSSADGIRQIDSLHRRSFESLAFSMDNSELVPSSSDDLSRTNETYFGVNLDAFRSDEDNFVRYANPDAAGYPVWQGEEITLVPDLVNDAATAIFLRSDVRVPFVVDFEYSIFNARTGAGWQHLPADGLAFMFLKDRGPYDRGDDPPAGSDRAFNPDGTGYGVHFRIFEGSAVELRDGRSRIIATSASSFYRSRIPPVYSDGQWRKVRIGVTETSVTVIYEGEQLLTYSGRIHSDFGAMGIGAANGDADAEHKVRHIKISPEARIADVAKLDRDRGFGRVVESAGATYTVDSLYGHNSAHGPVTVSRSGAGRYAVRFASLGGGGLPGGTVQITAEGPDYGMCKTPSWDSGRGDFIVNILCFDRVGRPADHPFNVTVIWPEVTQGSSGFGWANDPLAQNYTPTREYAYNSTGGDITAGRLNRGVYWMRFAGLGRSTAGANVQVTPYGRDNHTCKVENWQSVGTEFDARVRCFDGAGSPVDTRYSLLLFWPEESGRVGGFALANQPQTAQYDPNPAYAHNSAGSVVTATRNGVGKYSMRFENLGGTGRGVQVTAYGAGSQTCKVGDWDSRGIDFTVDVLCFDSTGRSVDTQYSLLVLK